MAQVTASVVRCCFTVTDWHVLHAFQKIFSYLSMSIDKDFKLPRHSWWKLSAGKLYIAIYTAQSLTLLYWKSPPLFNLLVPAKFLVMCPLMLINAQKALNQNFGRYV